MKETLQKLDVQKIFQYSARYALTEVGKNFLLEDVQAESRNEAEYFLDLTTEAKRFLETQADISLNPQADLSETLNKSKIEGMILSPKETRQILDLLINSRILKQLFIKNVEKFPLIFNLANRLYVEKLLEKNISDIVDEYYEIKDSASSELRKIRTEIREKKEHLQKVAESLLKKLSKQDFVQEELVTLRDGRIVLPIKTEYKRQIRGFVHSESASGLTTYIEPEETLELNNEILSLYFQEKREIERLMKKLTEEIAKASEQLILNQSIVAQIDAIFAKARYSFEIKGERINFSNDGSFELINCRHPVLIKNLGFDKTIPFSMKLSGDKRCLVLSGPNAGGKTVFMKTIGLYSIMSKMGYHLPVHADSKMPFFENIFIDIGDEQSIDNDLSTFGSHLSKIRDIYNAAKEKDLVLIDEIGTGTDPTEGSALAAGILKMFIDKGSFVIATTHHSFLKIFASTHESAINASMEFNLETLEPTYNFILGIPGSSYAFEIAERLQLPKEIIKSSKQFRTKKDVDIEKTIAELQKKLQTYSTLSDEVENKRNELNNLINDFNERLENLKKNEKALKQKAMEEAEHILTSANTLIEKAIKDIKDSKADSRVIKESKTLIREKIKSLEKEIEQFEALPETERPQRGDSVISKDNSIRGKLIEFDERKNHAIVAVGNLKVKTHYNSLLKLKTNLIEQDTRHSIQINQNYFNQRIDIRGKRVNEIELEVQKFLDDAIVMGISRVEILHGKGDGILKNFVKEILSKHPAVEYFTPAPFDQGGEGITIVKFKE